MPTPTFQPIQGNPSTAQIQDYIVKLIRDLNYMLGNLDTLNVNRLDAKVLIAQTITATQIAAGTITAAQIAVGTITADRMNVTQLSAISANMGTITAGNIYGAYIATSNGTYPRIELSSTGNLLTAYNDSTHNVGIDPDYFGNPSFFFRSPSCNTDVGIFGGTYTIDGTLGDVLIRSQTGDLNLDAATGAGYHVTLSSWSALYNITSSKTLQQDLNAKVNTGSTTNPTSVSDAHNHGFTTSDYIQCYDSGGTPTSKKQWIPYGGSASHTHTV